MNDATHEAGAVQAASSDVRNGVPPLGPMWPPIVVALVAMAAGAPLFFRDLAALGGDVYDPCTPVFGIPCLPHENPADYHIVGIPLSGLGMTYSWSVLLLIPVTTALGPVVARSARYFLWAMSYPAAGISCYLLFLLLTGLAHGCPYCMTGNVCSLLQVVALSWSLGGSFMGVPARAWQWLRGLFEPVGDDGSAGDRRRLEWLTLITSILLYAVVYSVVRMATLSSML